MLRCMRQVVVSSVSATDPFPPTYTFQTTWVATVTLLSVPGIQQAMVNFGDYVQVRGMAEPFDAHAEPIRNALKEGIIVPPPE